MTRRRWLPDHYRIGDGEPRTPPLDPSEQCENSRCECRWCVNDLEAAMRRHPAGKGES
jgi:hypothetical protein